MSEGNWISCSRWERNCVVWQFSQSWTAWCWWPNEAMWTEEKADRVQASSSERRLLAFACFPTKAQLSNRKWRPLWDSSSVKVSLIRSTMADPSRCYNSSFRRPFSPSKSSLFSCLLRPFLSLSFPITKRLPYACGSGVKRICCYIISHTRLFFIMIFLQLKMLHITSWSVFTLKPCIISG